MTIAIDISAHARGCEKIQLTMIPAPETDVRGGDSARQQLQLQELTIFQNNVHSVSNCLPQIQARSVELQPTMWALQETWLTDNESIEMEGYVCHCTNRQTRHRGGGVATLIRESAHAAQIQLPADFVRQLQARTVELVASRVQLASGHSLAVINVYIAYPSEAKLELLDHITSFVQRQVDYLMMCGDFNTHHSAWNSRLAPATSNSLGQRLHALFVEYGLTVLNSGQHTFHSANGEHSSAPDVTAVSSSLLQDTQAVEWQLGPFELGDDHQVIELRLQVQCIETTYESQRWCFTDPNRLDDKSKAKLTKAISAISTVLLQETEHMVSAGAVYDHFVTKLHQELPRVLPAVRQSCGTKHTQKPVWWDRECQAALRARRRARRQRNARELRQARRRLHKILQSKRQRYWNGVIDRMRSVRPLSVLFATAKRHFGTKRNPVPPMIDADGQLKCTMAGRAEVLNQHFVDVQTVQHDSVAQFWQQHRHDLLPLDDTDTAAATVNEPYNDTFDEAELVAALSSMKNSAPGDDRIGAAILKLAKLSTPLRELLLRMINLSWQTHRLPQQWKTARVVAIAKSGASSDPDIHSFI